MTLRDTVLPRFLLSISLVFIWFGRLDPSFTLFYYRNTHTSLNVLQILIYDMDYHIMRRYEI